MVTVPSIKKLIEKPANARTIYAWVSPYADIAAFPMTRNPDIGSFERWNMGFPLLDAERIVKLPGLPENLNVHRYADMTGRPDLFGDLMLDSDTLPRALPEILRVFGNLVARADFKAIVEREDPDGGHQFIPCAVTFPDGKPVGAMNYYHFICGRRISTRGDITLDFDVLRTDMAPENVRRLLRDHDTALALADVPLWAATGNEEPLYMSEAFFQATQAAGLPGWIEYSGFRGKAVNTLEEQPEYIGHAWIAPKA